MVIAVASLAAFIQVLGEACTRASNSLVTGAGRGGDTPYSSVMPERPTWTGRAFPGPCLFLLCTCTGWVKATISKLLLRSRLKAKLLDSPPQPPSDEPAVIETAPREPILTLPLALTAYVVLLALIHLRVLLPPELENWTIDVFGFIPKRYDSSLANLQIPGGAGAKVWTFVTYSLLHANLTHLAFNVLWLLPFGSALARRFGAVRFFLFLAVTAAAGALAHLVTHEHAVVPMIGASASVSGAMAAAIRFAFVRGSFLSFSRSDADTAARVPALPLLRALRDRRIVGFLVVWFALNIIFGVGAIGVDSESAGVAWEAHIGGFFAGLLLFALFDPVPRVRSDAADASSQDVSDGI